MKSIVSKNGYEINVGTENGKFVYRLYKNGELLEKDCTGLIDYSDLILDLALELDETRSQLKAIYSGEEIPKVLFDDDHVDHTYKMATYYKNLKDKEKKGSASDGTDYNSSSE